MACDLLFGKCDIRDQTFIFAGPPFDLTTYNRFILGYQFILVHNFSD